MNIKGLIRMTTLGGLALLTGALLALPSTALAKGKPQPYKIKGTITLTPTEVPGVFQMYDVGESTYLGHYVNTGWLAFTFDADGNLVILGGKGTAVAANGRDYSNWHMEAGTGRVIFDGADEGRFEGEEGYFDSTILTMDLSAGVVTYIGVGQITFPH